MIIGLSIGAVFLCLLVTIIIAALFFLKRRKANSTDKRSTSSMCLRTFLLQSNFNNFVFFSFIRKNSK